MAVGRQPHLRTRPFRTAFEARDLSNSAVSDADHEQIARRKESTGGVREKPPVC